MIMMAHTHLKGCLPAVVRFHRHNKEICPYQILINEGHFGNQYESSDSQIKNAFVIKADKPREMVLPST
jgi:hypothetical protein